MARRSLSDPGEVGYYLAYAPVDIEIAELARIAGSRWAIEKCFQAAIRGQGPWVPACSIRSCFAAP